MDLARYVMDAVVLEGRSYREVPRAHWISKSYVGELMGRFRQGGYDAIEQRSMVARRIPHRTPDVLEDEIVTLRKEAPATSRCRWSRRSCGCSAGGGFVVPSRTNGPRGSGWGRCQWRWRSVDARWISWSSRSAGTSYTSQSEMKRSTLMFRSPRSYPATEVALKRPPETSTRSRSVRPRDSRARRSAFPISWASRSTGVFQCRARTGGLRSV
jgi:hypothetical protein